MGNMAEVQRTNIYNNGVTAAAIDDYATDANAHIVAAKEAFTTSLDQLTNVVAANHKKVERNFEVLTGVVRDFKQAGEDDRELINGNQQKIADNSLSLKAYAVSAESKLVKYVGHGKGKNLSSLGDLMINIAALADVEIEKEEGLSPS